MRGDGAVSSRIFNEVEYPYGPLPVRKMTHTELFTAQQQNVINLWQTKDDIQNNVIKIHLSFAILK